MSVSAKKVTSPLRKSVGRPRKAASEKLDRFQLDLTPEDRTSIEAICHHYGLLSLAAGARLAVRELARQLSAAHAPAASLRTQRVS